jgi:hypothetical protein
VTSRLRLHRPRATTIARATTASALAGALAFTVLIAPGGAEQVEVRDPAADAYPVALDQEDLVPEVVVVRAADKAAVARLVSTGYEVVEEPEAAPGGGLGVQVVATKGQQKQMERLGYDVIDVLVSKADMEAMQQENAELRAQVLSAEAPATDELSVLRAEWFENSDGNLFVNFEVRSTDGASSQTTITAAFDDGTARSVNLSRFVDAGQYQYHRVNSPVPIASVPESVTFTSSQGDVETATLTEWLGQDLPPSGPNYQTGFIDRYLDAVESTERIEALAAEFPDLAEIVELPYETHGYRRPAMGIVGGFTNTVVVYTTLAYGHEGGDDVTVQHVNPGVADSPLTVSVSGDAITVSLATNASGALTSTAAQVVAAVNASPAASALVRTNTYRGNAGAGVAQVSGIVQLDDYLNAPDHISREPVTVKAIRIGEKRDGSKTGVLVYSQEHAREWVTPLVAVESAERLLRNAKTDAGTKQLLRDLDIFIIPTVNPDGTNYSMYDNTLQRRNMNNYCGPGQPNDVLARNAWGVDLNRNFSVGSRLDGYDGASGSCTSDVYSGPSELSEPEARNEVWLTDTFTNIRFSMNVHSHGGYFMWAPGAYKLAGRETLPRPSKADEDFFWSASSRILSRIQEHRGTAVWPGRTGPVADVLYSAAGNSADEQYYTKGIYAWNFEVGSPLWNGTNWQAVGFTPPYAEGYEESQEFANGVIGLLEVAAAYGNDVTPPKSELVTSDEGITFTTSEDATVHYTTDGSRPTFESPRLSARAVRDGAETIPLPSGTTTVYWFSIDAAGNVESRYDPTGKANNYRKDTVTVP